MTSLCELFAADTIQVLLCDADGNLFPSEEPAFVASSAVTNALLGSLEVSAAYSAEELRLSTTGKNFRTTALELCLRHGVGFDSELLPTGSDGAATQSSVKERGITRSTLSRHALEHWVAMEAEVVSQHLADTLKPDAAVTEPLVRLAERYLLAVVSSSALMRLRECLAATELHGFFPPETIFSAEDSLPFPAGKPDPAVYRLAGASLGFSGAAGLAIEDSTAGVASAVAAGFPAVGNLQFVPEGERCKRADELISAGASALVESWGELADLLLP